MNKKKKGFERLLCLDLSLNSTGFVVLDVNRKTSELLIQKIGTTDTTKKKDWGEKYEIIYNQMVYLRESVIPDSLIIERPFMRFEIPTRALLGALGMVRLAFKGFKEPVFISPNHIKKILGGHGHAKKYMVKERLEEMFPEVEFRNDDESDALGVAVTYLIDEGVL